MAVAETPHLEILVRGAEGFSIWNGPPFSDGKPNVKHDNVHCTSVKYSDNGSRIMVVSSDSIVSIYDARSFAEIRSIPVPNLLAASISPNGTYVQTFQKSTSSQDKNVSIWSIATGDSVYQVFQKSMTKSTWPSLQFSSDEAVGCRFATNEIQFLDPMDLSKGIIHRLRVPGIASFELSKSPGSYVAAFVPESKGMPANVQIFSCLKELQNQPVARKSFFRCSSVLLKWNCGSTGLLVVVQSDVDKTNQSYYGESKLNYLTTDGAYEGLVPLRKEGPVHDAQWSFSGKEFAVVYGYVPAMVTIFDRKCNPLLELGSGPYNTIRWNPKGKFICVAGFGNLPGDMAFWDYTKKVKLRDTKAELSVTSEWSPDGRYFMTATTAPRLQVDNGIKIFLHNGSLHFKKMFDRLFQADWKYESPDKFGDISELSDSVGSMKLEEPAKGSKTSQTSKGATVANPPVQKPAAYRPPHSKAAAAIQAELLGVAPPGEMSKNALKNKKKREKQREKKAASSAVDES